MKKLYSLLLGLTISGGLWAQSYNVTFQVDMTGQTVSANGVHIAGNFQAAAGAASDWDPAATALTQVGSSNIYSVQVSIPAGLYEYKMINDNTWGGAEAVPSVAQVDLGQGNDNRWIEITGDTTLAAVMFSGSAPAGMKALTMIVDMSQQSVVGDTVSVAGSFQNWTPGTSMMTNLNAADSMYRYIAYLTPGTPYEWKFLNGAAWGTDESVPASCAMNGNRFANITNDSIYGPVCFANCAACFIPDTFNITIRVDVSAVCGFNDTIDIAGPFNNWPGGFDMAHMLTDTDGDDVYEITVQAAAPEFTYKARYHNNGTNWEDGNNKVVNFSGDTVLNIRCFGADAYGACAPKPNPSDLTFQVDMSNYSGAINDIYLIAGFLGWQGGAIKLDPVTGMPGVFGTTVTGVCPGRVAYKFVNGDPNNGGIEEDLVNSDSTCTEPSGTGSLNRFFVRPNDQPTTIGHEWNTCVSIIGLENGFEVQKLNIYPNPANSSTTVELGNNGLFNLKLADVTGKPVFMAAGVNGNYEIRVGQLEAGVYLLNVENEKGEVNTSKLIVR